MKALLTTLGLAVWATVATLLFAAMLIIGYRAAFPGAPLGARESKPSLAGRRPAGEGAAVMPAAPGAPAGADSIAVLLQRLQPGALQRGAPALAVDAQPAQGGLAPDPAAGMACPSQEAPDCGAAAANAASVARSSHPESAYPAGDAQFALQREQLGERVRQLLPDLGQERDRFMAYRLLYMTGWMRAAEFQELAQRLDDAGLGLEASLSRSRAAGQATPGVEAGAALRVVESAAADGDADSLARLGEWYVAAGRTSDAIDVLEKALARGLAAPADASIYLCLAEERLGNTDAARRAAAAVAAAPGQDPRLAELWRFYRPL